MLMPRRDVHHEVVKRALRTDGWNITHDPLPYRIEDEQIFIDLAAERVLGAERGNTKSAVEIKSFISPSPLTDLQEALGFTRSPRSICSVSTIFSRTRA
jgi:hypothetical protein